MLNKAHSLLRFALPAVVLAGAISAPAAAVAAENRPDLTVTAVKGVPSAVGYGSAFKVKVTVRNGGTLEAKKSALRMMLAATRRSKRGVNLATARVPALQPKKSVVVRVSIKAPAAPPPLSSLLLTCSDSANAMREVSERNNCRATKINLLGSGSPGVSPDPSPGGSPVPSPPAPPCVPSSATDLPDPAFVDADCDGIDGQISDSIFVATTGVNDVGCGALADPCGTIGRGSEQAAATDKPSVFVAGGTYSRFKAASGVSVYGGFGANFQRDPAKATGSRTATVEGSFDGTVGQTFAVLARDLAQPITLADLTIRGQDVSSPAGRSSYAVIADASTVVIIRDTVIAGNGAPGQDGGDGGDASSTPAQSGTNGGPADEFVTACNNTSRGAGGPGGTNSPPSGTDPDGGDGGAGGTMDTDCSLPDFDFAARPGVEGEAAATISGIFGTAGPSGDLCGPGLEGKPGRVINGVAGTVGGGHGKLVDSWWTGNSGTAGGVGQNGGGGGGGGGSGGCDDGTDSYGAGGGGGGAGGMAAPSAGGGGGAGGGSFGVFAVMSTVTVTETTIDRGDGGVGGDGGAGGTGQPGGSGGKGGAEKGSKKGGDGGSGGHGGHSGGGGGGAGGVSFGIYSYASAIDQSANFLNGAGGAGGSGGLVEGDGNDGPTGPTGQSGNIGTCNAPGNC